MRLRILVAFLFFAFAVVLVYAPVAESQKGGFGKGGFGKGGGGTPPGGGFGKGGGGTPPGGFGGKGGSVTGSDPDRVFDMLARGRNFFLISDTRSLREPLTKWAEENRITNGQITRDQFASFMKTRAESGMFGPGGGAPGGGGPRPGPGGDMKGPPGPDRTEALLAYAESDFKERDQNDDGYLNSDEVPSTLRNDFGKWDNNRDNLISLNEYKTYFTSRFQRSGEDRERAIVENIIDLEGLDARPVVLRAGKMSDKLPKWFLELDIDKDGQVALYEWRRGGKEIDEFPTFDLNGDALLTQEEALKMSGRGSGEMTASASPWGDRKGGGKGGFGGFGGGDKGGFGGFGGDKGGFGKGGFGGFGGDKGGFGGGGKKFEFKRPQ